MITSWASGLVTMPRTACRVVCGRDDDVDTVLGLMGKELNKVPIPGSVVEWEGIQLVAERGIGRRNNILTVLASLVEDTEADPADAGVDAAAQLASDSAKRAS